MNATGFQGLYALTLNGLRVIFRIDVKRSCGIVVMYSVVDWVVAQTIVVVLNMRMQRAGSLVLRCPAFWLSGFLFVSVADYQERVR